MNNSGNNIINKVLGKALIMTLVVSMLSGCSLAEKEDNSNVNEKSNKDTFCGVFISMKDLFDADVKLTDEEIMRMISGEEPDSNEEEYKEKIYAVRTEENKDGHVTVDYTFEGCEGVELFCYNYRDGEDWIMDCAIDYNGQSAISDFKTSIDSSNGVETIKLSGIVNINKEYLKKIKKSEGQCLLYAQSVYQTPEGDLYMLPADCNYDVSAGGFGFSRYDTTKINVEGKVQEKTISADVKAKVILSVDKTVLYIMNAENKVIDTVEINNENVPEIICVEKDAEYVIIEKYTNGEISSREMEEFEEEEELSIALPIKTKDNIFICESQVELKK